MNDQEIRYLGDLQRLELKPGEKLVLTVPGRLSDEQVDRIQSELERVFPGVLAVVLTEGMKLGVVSQESEVVPE